MSSGVPPVPATNQMIDKNGNLTSGWANWFKQVYIRIGGATAPTNNDLSGMFPVVTANIANSAVTAAKIATGAVGSAAIASGAVGAAALATGAVGSSALAASAVGTAALAAGGVSFAKLLSTDWTDSFAASGYQKLGSGLYIQWGISSSIATGTNTVVSFPATFPTACLQVIAGIQGNSASATNATGQFGTGAYTASNFTLYNRTSLAQTFNYFAVGY